ncbi:hypothetical protein [Streptomyces sp. NPDC058548]|uniref:hypothetical protein n=1 Tax=Streptomyces sp. NPDC058548 TaxID=3346545 RepID=UPI003665A691
MHPRRTTVLVLAALLTSGCMAIPHTPAPRPTAARPGGLEPAADRTPAPIPTWTTPTPGTPREELAAAGRESAPPAPAAPAADRTAEPPPRPARRAAAPAERPSAAAISKRRKPAAGRTSPSSAPQTPKDQKKPFRPAPVRRQQQPTGQAPEMRQLCREAGRINAPMGAADLCRSTYGR